MTALAPAATAPRFKSLPRDSRADIVRDLAATGMSRKQIAEQVGAPHGSIDTLCKDYRIRTVHPTTPTAEAHAVHPGWDYEPDRLRRWFQTMDRRFAQAMSEAGQ